MRKKLDTRFPAARIKKIMQADEDVGKIAMAVPLLVSKALELFLQDLCDHTYEITLKRGAKTLNSLHLKQCVQTFNVFDFLRDIVSKVPDLGGFDAAGEDRSAAKRRKVTDDDENDSDDEFKRTRMQEACHSISSGRGRGRVRGRGCGRGSRTVEQEVTAHSGKFEDDSEISKHNQGLERLNNGVETEDSKEQILASKGEEAPIRNFDLNVVLDENGDLETVAAGSGSSCAEPVPETKHDEYHGWSLPDMEKMAIDPIQLANFSRRIDEDEEDYDEEG
ncbi:dr1-associated corepressor-like [Juglans microcarpa x Juglans regia]|uniref:dr1-associated corepressor-like n=1 Tax=Juglans microcarpa x Juglans regia TaxID=2249226 RepID=UPI001B7F709A|nr:dr1-associated corepressor-like [Juglans microcarpa x Juglans regia]